MSLNIIVCVKQVPDPTAHASGFVVTGDSLRVETNDVAAILNPFDENALEAALRIKDATRDSVKITVLTVGYNVRVSVMQKALAPGADELIIVDDESFAFGSVDSFVIVHALAAAIRKMEKYDLILLGRMSADMNSGQTAVAVGQILNLPAITMVTSMEVRDEVIVAERVLLNTRITVQAPLPAVVMVNSDSGALRYPTFPQILASKKRSITTWSAQDLDIEACGARPKLTLRKLYKPERAVRDCVIVEGETAEEAASSLADLLRKDHVI
jgi:electron transfer flavoprotein beta subunit